MRWIWAERRCRRDREKEERTIEWIMEERDHEREAKEEGVRSDLINT